MERVEPAVMEIVVVKFSLKLSNSFCWAQATPARRVPLISNCQSDALVGALKP